MPSDFRTELTLPAEARIQRLVSNYGHNLAVLANFPEDQAELLAQALWEACKNSIEYAYDADDESGLITLVGELTPKALTLAVRDQGLPFDQTLDPESPCADPESFCQLPWRGLGLSLIHQCADEVRWINHGAEGKELRLTKYRRGWCRLEPQTAPPPRSSHEGAPTKRPWDYAIRLVRPEDAIRVAQLMYRVYGYSYPRVDIYYPERLAHNIKTGTHVGVVAVGEDGEIAGHAGIMRPNPEPLAELGEIAVAPLHRGQGLYKRMEERLHEEIRRLGLIGFYAEAVTVHTISQEGCEGRGLHPTGIELLDVQMHFKKLEIIQRALGYQDNHSGPGPQRETALVCYFNHLVPPETTQVCVPARHRAILAKIYKNLGVPVKFLRPGRAAGSGRLVVHFNRNIGAGFIQVNRIGTDTFPEIEQARRDLCDLAEAAVVFLDLPLAQRGTPDLCDAVETVGFFFSGVRPRFTADGDFLRLQFLNTALDPERIHLASPFARELLDYILRDKARVEQNRSK
jgi:anti-sigma regulatory factor (Ser/Thr protein kinase)/GNAT superfamily N-acetyltransferase/cold shock CspA family protein